MMSGRRRSVIDLLSDPAKLQAQIKAYDQAAEARVRASEDYQKKKEDALSAISDLQQKQNEHDNRKQELDAVHIQLSTWKNRLHTQEVQHAAQVDELVNQKRLFEQDRLKFLQDLKESAAKLANREEEIKKLQIELTKKIDDYSKLLLKEELINKREQFLISVASQLTEAAIQLKS